MFTKTNRIRQALTAALFGFAGTAFGLPLLQLTILNGNYVGGSDETTYASGNPFTLYALLTPPNGNCDTACVSDLLADSYYISAAVVPKTGPGNTSLGSFTFGGATVNVTSDMVYGTPPLDTVATQLSDPGDLSDHGIFDTFFKQFTFQFDSNVSTDPFDAQTTTPNALLVDDDKGMYFFPFSINIANLNANTSIHFDLYNSEVVECGRNPNCTSGDIDVNAFAPYSHDAQSSSTSSTSSSGGGGGSVPEPSTLSLLGCMAVLGALFQFRRRRQAHA